MDARFKAVGPKDWFNALYRSPFFTSDMPISQITTKTLKDYVNYAQGKGLRNSYIKRHTHLAIKQGIKLAMKAKLPGLDLAHVEDLEYPKLPKESREQQDPKRAGRYLKPKLIAEVCKNLPRNYALTVQFVLGTGLRKEELLLVTPEMVEYPGLENDYTKPHLCLPRIPFGNTARQIPLGKKSLAAFEELAMGHPPGSPIFKRNVAQALKMLSVKLKLKYPFKLRDLRHCYGTKLGQRGKSLSQIAYLMGNSEQSCVRYLHTTVKWNEDAIDEIEDFDSAED